MIQFLVNKKNDSTEFKFTTNTNSKSILYTSVPIVKAIFERYNNYYNINNNYYS